jgi:NAD(P)-dependent dehydrogenase (short-subunit alcohol dehydrogenase family)
LAARNIDKLAPLAAGIGAERFAVDASDPAAVARLFEDVDTRLGAPDVVLYNASARAHGPIAEIDPEAVRKAVEVSAFGAFLVIQQAVRRMMPQGRGAILLTGASASVKGYPLSVAFAMGKFALRGLAQSTARELGPKGIHVAHFVIDGGVRSTPLVQPDISRGEVAKAAGGTRRRSDSARIAIASLTCWPLDNAACRPASEYGGASTPLSSAPASASRSPVSFPAADPRAIAVSAMGRTGTFPAGAVEEGDVAAPFGTDKKNFVAAYTLRGSTGASSGTGSGASAAPQRGHGGSFRLRKRRSSVFPARRTTGISSQAWWPTPT